MEKEKQNSANYSPEFKISVIIDMRENGLGYREAMRKYGITGHHTVQNWERIYLTEGEVGLMAERRGKSSKGSPRKKPIPMEVEQDLLDEVQRLRERNEYLEMENEYLKKLDALVRAEEQRNGKKPK